MLSWIVPGVIFHWEVGWVKGENVIEVEWYWQHLWLKFGYCFANLMSYDECD